MTKLPKDLLKKVIKDEQLRKKWKDCSYDGILGILPDWMQLSIDQEFGLIQSKLLRTGGYSPARIKQYIDSHLERMNHLEQVNQHAKPFEEKLPKMIGITPIPKDIRGDIERLSWIKHAVDAGYPEGLGMLHGSDAKQIVSYRTYRKVQSEKARKPRGKIGNNETTIRQFIQKLALSNEHKEDSHKELWQHFYWKLEEERLDPEEKPHASDLDKSCYLYNFNDKRKSISFGNFVNVITKSRNK